MSPHVGRADGSRQQESLQNICQPLFEIVGSPAGVDDQPLVGARLKSPQRVHDRRFLQTQWRLGHQLGGQRGKACPPLALKVGPEVRNLRIGRGGVLHGSQQRCDALGDAQSRPYA